MIDEDKMFVLRIITDAYSGNFERDMTAYCTGQIGDCETGEELADIFQTDFPEKWKGFNNSMTVQPDEYGCYRPCRIAQSGSGKGYDSVDILFDERLSKEDVDFIVERAKEYCAIDEPENYKHPIGFVGFKLLEETVQVTVVEYDS